MANLEAECSVESKISPQVVGAVVSTIAALGVVASSPKVAKMSKVASVVGLAALVAWLARKVGPEGFKNTGKKDHKKNPVQRDIGTPCGSGRARGSSKPCRKTMPDGK